MVCIEFNKKGGCCNFDVIDNFVGVNLFDMEVNIKIVFGVVVKVVKLDFD